MTPSTKRALRTGYQLLVALITAVPVIVLVLPGELATEAVVVAFAAWVAVVTKAHNALEDAGLIPAWLKDEEHDVPEAHDIDFDDEP